MQEVLLSQAINNPVLGPSLGSLNGVGFFQRLLPALILGALMIGVIVFFFMFLSGAVSWITSGGDKAKTETAKSRLTNAIVGLVILLSFFAIINLIELFFGVSLLRLNLAPLFIGGAGGGGGGGGGVSAACPCSAALGGGCASVGAVAVGPGGACYQCASSGWSGPVGGSCGPISCSPCP